MRVLIVLSFLVIVNEVHCLWFSDILGEVGDVLDDDKAKKIIEVGKKHITNIFADFIKKQPKGVQKLWKKVSKHVAPQMRSEIVKKWTNWIESNAKDAPRKMKKFLKKIQKAKKEMKNVKTVKNGKKEIQNLKKLGKEIVKKHIKNVKKIVKEAKKKLGKMKKLGSKKAYKKDLKIIAKKLTAKAKHWKQPSFIMKKMKKYFKDSVKKMKKHLKKKSKKEMKGSNDELVNEGENVMEKAIAKVFVKPHTLVKNDEKESEFEKQIEKLVKEKESEEENKDTVDDKTPMVFDHGNVYPLTKIEVFDQGTTLAPTKSKKIKFENLHKKAAKKWKKVMKKLSAVSKFGKKLMNKGKMDNKSKFPTMTGNENWKLYDSQKQRKVFVHKYAKGMLKDEFQRVLGNTEADWLDEKKWIDMRLKKLATF